MGGYSVLRRFALMLIFLPFFAFILKVPVSEAIAVDSNNNVADLECEDDASFLMPVNRTTPVERDCAWVQQSLRRCKFPHKRSTIGALFCPVTCNLCMKHLLPTCSDSSLFLSRTRLKGCSWVAEENTNDRCNMSFENNKLETYCPRTCGLCPTAMASSAPSLNPTKRADDLSFNGTIPLANAIMKNCSWVNEDKANRCDIPHKTRTIGSIFCPVTCDACSELNVYGCVDTDRVMIRTQTINCEWVALDLSSRCNMVYGNVMIGDAYCPQTCGHCDSRRYPSSSPLDQPTFPPTTAPPTTEPPTTEPPTTAPPTTEPPTTAPPTTAPASGSPSMQQSSCLHLFEMNITTDDKPQDIYWELVDSNYNVLPRSEYNNYKLETLLPNWDTLEGNHSIYQNNTHYYHRQCINTNECITLRLFDSGRNGGSQYVVSWDGIQIIETTQSGTLDTVRFGINCDQPFCAAGESLFELDLRTDWFEDEFNFELINSNNVLYSGNPTVKLGYHYYGKCLSITDQDCKTLDLTDDYGDGGTVYTVSWNGTLKEYGGKMVAQNIKLRHGVDCNPCAPDHSYFELNVTTGNSPTAFSWELSNSNDATIAYKNNYTTPHQTDQITLCVPATRDSCALLNLTGTSSSYGTGYLVYWNTILFADRKLWTANEFIPLGTNCQELLCPPTLQLFEIYFRTDEYPEDFSWKLLGPNNALYFSGSGYTATNSNFYRFNCVPDNICYTVEFHDSYYDGGTSYSILFNGTVQVEGKQPSDENKYLRINVGNC